MKNSKLNNTSDLKNTNTRDQSGSDKKKVMTNNYLVKDFTFQPTNTEILSMDTLMRYVQGIMPSSERVLVEAEIFQKGNEFYIDAVKGLIKLLDKENGNAEVTMNKLVSDVEDIYPRFLIKRKFNIDKKPYNTSILTEKKDVIDKPEIVSLDQLSRVSVEQ